MLRSICRLQLPPTGQEIPCYAVRIQFERTRCHLVHARSKRISKDWYDEVVAMSCLVRVIFITRCPFADLANNGPPEHTNHLMIRPCDSELETQTWSRLQYARCRTSP